MMTQTAERKHAHSPGAEHGDVKMKVHDTVQDQLRDLFCVTWSIGGPNR